MKVAMNKLVVSSLILSIIALAISLLTILILKPTNSAPCFFVGMIAFVMLLSACLVPQVIKREKPSSQE